MSYLVKITAEPGADVLKIESEIQRAHFQAFGTLATGEPLYSWSSEQSGEECTVVYDTAERRELFWGKFAAFKCPGVKHRWRADS